MIYNQIKCEAFEVKTESGVCPGRAKIERGEIFVLGARTPSSKGICFQALSAIGPMKLAMSLTEQLDMEKDGSFNITCPHSVVTYRLSRLK